MCIRDSFVGLLVDVELSLLPALGSENLVPVGALVAERADEVEVAHLAAALVLRVREEQPAFVERVVAAPVVRDLHVLPGLGRLRIELVTDEEMCIRDR